MTTMRVEHTPTGWTPDDSTFGARLALVRQRMKWGNVKEAATECGLPPESWRQWERDGAMPRRIVEVSRIIAGRTGCDRLWLLEGPNPDVDTAITRRSSPLDPRIITRPPSRPRSEPIDSRPAIVRRRLAA